MKKQPEITARTRKRLMDAFWELYKERRIEKISIGAITKLAGVNRGTFYEYFTDIYELLDETENEILDSLESTLGEWHKNHGAAFASDNEGSFKEFTKYCARIFIEYDEKLFVMLNPKGNSTFQVKLKAQLKPHLIRIINMQYPQERKAHMDYMIDFVISTITSLLNCWHNQEKKLDIEELLTMMQVLIFSGIFGYQKYDNKSVK